MKKRNNNSILETFIKEEVKNSLFDYTQKQLIPLYVFDFDETLISSQSKVIVNRPDGSQIKLSHQEMYQYEVKPLETLDVSEFEQIINPTIYTNIMKLFLKHINNAVVLTARAYRKPIEEFFEEYVNVVPEIVTVGDKQPTENPAKRNAVRKRIWIENAIKERNLNHVEFWDDNFLNIQEVSKLKALYPNVKILTHLVKHQF